jgi:hypothetical protein
MEPEKSGKTLWEMLCERVRGQGNGAGIAFYNPLGLGTGSAVPVPYANGAEFAACDFTVQEIREYNRRIGGQDFRFADYVLRGVNTKSFQAEDGITVRLRTVPNQAGACDSLLLRLFDEFAFAEDFLAVVKDDTGIFEVTDDPSGAKETFSRINNLRTSYEAAVLVVARTTPDAKAAAGGSTAAKIEYWDFWRDIDLDPGKKEFLFIEMNSDTGWFQIWRGREFFP